jgi:hypothetical protein
LVGYIGRLRVGAHGKAGGIVDTSTIKGVSTRSAAKLIKKDDAFVSAADLFNTLTKHGNRPRPAP